MSSIATLFTCSIATTPPRALLQSSIGKSLYLVKGKNTTFGLRSDGVDPRSHTNMRRRCQSAVEDHSYQIQSPPKAFLFS